MLEGRGKKKPNVQILNGFVHLSHKMTLVNTLYTLQVVYVIYTTRRKESRVLGVNIKYKGYVI